MVVGNIFFSSRSLLYVDNQGYVPALLESLSVCLALELIGSWVVVGFSVGMEAFGWSLIP